MRFELLTSLSSLYDNFFFSDDNKSNYYYLTASANRQNYFYPIITILLLRKFVSRMYWEYSSSIRVFKRMNYQRIKYLRCSKIFEVIRSCKNKIFFIRKIFIFNTVFNSYSFRYIIILFVFYYFFGVLFFCHFISYFLGMSYCITFTFNNLWNV